MGHELVELSRRVGDRIARILGGEPGSVQIQPNASIALATVASCFDFNSGRNKVVTTALDFPSMEYFWDAQRQIGARVEVVPSPDNISVPSKGYSTRSITKRVSSRSPTRRIAVLIASMPRRLSSARTQKARSCCSTFINLPASYCYMRLTGTSIF